ncbi:AhpD-like protein [Rhexocercosporidium sp. MPI-PUGE-AT-0058]|nr:AhpD-like protein [Rhexocercosporidium sp. MPI-PUGE-AT-0058]
MAPSRTLPSIVTPSLLKYIQSHPQLPEHTWYFIAATTLTILNRPDEIQVVFRHALREDPDHPPLDSHQQLLITRRTREALLKASSVGGVPKTINALLALKNVTPPDLQPEDLEQSPTGRRSDVYEVAPSEVLERGQNFFEKVYGKIAKRVMRQMDTSGTEDLGLIARLMYAHILSNTSILNGAETSYVLIAALIPQDVNPQLKGHLRGAQNGGATIEEVRAVRNIVMRICESAGMRKLEDTDTTGWGWREDVATL